MGSPNFSLSQRDALKMIGSGVAFAGLGFGKLADYGNAFWNIVNWEQSAANYERVALGGGQPMVGDFGRAFLSR